LRVIDFQPPQQISTSQLQEIKDVKTGLVSTVDSKLPDYRESNPAVQAPFLFLAGPLQDSRPDGKMNFARKRKPVLEVTSSERHEEGIMSSEGALTGQVALVTGASRGIGLAIASRLGRMGARVSICARDTAKLDSAASGLRAGGITVLAKATDVGRRDEVEALVGETQRKLGPIDILVNNAGFGVFGSFLELSESDWDQVLATNLKAVFLVSRAVAPGMVRRKAGHIINISSLAGKHTFANGAIYCASKWGLQGLAGCMAEDLRAHGVRVSTVCPGSVATDFSRHAGKDGSRMLQAEDIAYAVGMLVTQAPGSFISEVQMRPTRKP
jgi:3-oxoacyl-[acyl-carrier protein] reductase